nr:hypothetical protein [Methylorubrum zatmanii]
MNAVSDGLSGLGLPVPEATAALLQRTLACVLRNLATAQRLIRSDAGMTYRGKRGWYTPRSQPRRPHEESVSSAIAKEFERMRRLSFDNCLEAFDLNAVCEVGRDDEEGIGPASKPIDLRIYNWGRGDTAFDLRIEAKIAHRQSGLGEYFSPRGIGRFLDEREPLTFGTIGAMAAYVLTDDVATWHAEVEGGSADYTALSDLRLVRLAPDLQPIPVSVVALPYASRLSLRLLFHIVLEFDMDPAVR